MIIVQTASRLHFGLLSLRSGRNWPGGLGQETIPGRRFGGVGLMVQSPGIELRMSPAKHWWAHGPLAERALAFAHRVAETLERKVDAPDVELRRVSASPQKIIIKRCAPEHAGLGTGTQLGLAVARGLSLAWDGRLPGKELCHRVDRAARSALGFYGFFHGGFMVEAGQNLDFEIAPLVVREHFPEDWRMVLAIPAGETGLSGIKEAKAIEELLAHGIPLQYTDRMCRLVLLGLLPALMEHDIKGFGETLFEFNNLAGQPFANIQGGTYASPQIAELIQFIRRQGISGAGQSSWGPTVFAIAEDESRANDLAAKIRQSFNFQKNEVLVTSACNEGARVSEVFE
jgi:beta-RFAP synthase